MGDIQANTIDSLFDDTYKRSTDSYVSTGPSNDSNILVLLTPDWLSTNNAQESGTIEISKKPASSQSTLNPTDPIQSSLLTTTPYDNDALSESSESSTSILFNLEDDIDNKCIFSDISTSGSCSEEENDTNQDFPLVPMEITVDGPKPDISEYKYQELYQHLTTVCQRRRGVAYISKSFPKYWQESDIRVPSHVICDAVIFSPSWPVTLLTFTSNEGDKVTKYNTKTARHLITSVRKSLFPSFSVVSGTVDKNALKTEDEFFGLLETLDDDAGVYTVEDALSMDSQKYENLLNFFKKINADAMLKTINSIKKINDKQTEYVDPNEFQGTWID